MNIVEMILKSLSGETLQKLAAAIGESPESVQKALTAIVPTILSGLGSLATSPQGGEKLWNSLRSVDGQVADELGGILAGGGADELAKKGASILEDFLGKGGLAALIGPIAKYIASNPELVKKLLPLVVPFILSFLGKQIKDSGFDLTSLLKLLLAQKANIAKAMPAELRNSLAGVQGLGDLTTFASNATKRLTSTDSNTLAQSADSIQWFVPIMALIALLAAGAWWLNQPKPAVEDPAKTIENRPAADTGAVGVTPGPQDPAESITSTFSGYVQETTRILDSVTDVPTAESAAPQLTGLTSQMDALAAAVENLPESSRAIVSSIVKQGQKTLQDKADKVLAVPGVGEILKPILDRLLEKVSSLIKRS